MGIFGAQIRLMFGSFLCATSSYCLPIFSSDFDYPTSPPTIVSGDTFKSARDLAPVSTTPGMLSFFPGQMYGPWTVGGGQSGTFGIDRKSGIYWQPPPGGRFSIDLAGQLPGSISTPIGVTSGNLYRVDFYLSGNPEWKVFAGYPGGPIKIAEVSAAGQSQTFTFDTTNTNNANMGWVAHSFYFVANSGQIDLRFVDVSSIIGGFGPVVGMVEVYDLGLSSTPEPATMALMGATLLGLASIRRRLGN